jgi:segregation and condensation protein B
MAEEEDVPDIGPEARSEILERRLRIIEALLFASAEPLGVAELAGFLDEGADVAPLLDELAARYAGRGVNLVRRGERWAFRTAPDLGFLLRREQPKAARCRAPRSKRWQSLPITSPRPAPK